MHRNKLDFEDILLISLALSDLLEAVLWNFEQHCRENGYTACVFSRFFLTFLGLVSISHLVCLAAERYVSVVKPFFYEIMCRRRRCTVSISVASWIYAFLWAIPPIFGISSYAVETEIALSISWKGKSRTDKIYISLLFVFCFFASDDDAYTVFFDRDRVQTNVSKFTKGTGQHSQMVRNTYKIAKINNLLVLAVITTLLVAWTPYAVISLKYATFLCL